LANNGLDDRKRIISADAPTPYLFNVQPEFVERFRKQITTIDLINEGSPEVIRQAVWSCYQEQPTPFGKYELYDHGAYPAEPLSGKITWKITQPSMEPKSDEERTQREKIQSLVERIKQTTDKRHA
jgi:tetrahydromethanopterin S-methyltransferase subunit A